MRTNLTPANSPVPEKTNRLRIVDELARKRDFRNAHLKLDRLLALAPGDPDLLSRRASFFLAENRLEEALPVLRQITRLQPTDPTIHNTLGSILAHLGDQPGASHAFGKACELAPRRGDYWFNLGKSLEQAGDIPEARSAYDQAVRLAPTDVAALVARSLCFRALGQIESATTDLRNALRIDPDSLQAWTGLLDLKSTRLDQAELAHLGNLYDRASTPERKTAFGFVYGRALEADAQYPEAHAVLTQSNAAKSRRIPWPADSVTRYVDAAITAFEPGLASSPNDDLGREVIFLVGMPRSGSTLTEQILSSHPDVAAAGEITDAHAVIAAESRRHGIDLFTWAPRATPGDWTRLGHLYMERTAAYRHHKHLFTDKQLDNWRYIGILHAMLPGARFVFCQRDPVETCWSCFKHSFHDNRAGFIYSQEHLARYWKDLQRLLGFWNSLLPGLVYQHDHERLLGAPEASIRDLLDHCGLPFDAACLKFNENRRSVLTASAGQVRQALQRRTAVTEHYGELLNPLRKALFGDHPDP